MKRLFLSPLLGLFLASAAQAQEVQIGGHAGAIGHGSEAPIAGKTAVGGGAFVTVNPYGWAALQMDFSLTDFGTGYGGFYFGASPSLVFYPVDYSEMKIGVMFGPGFHKYGEDNLRFGLNVGILGEFALSDNFVLGMQTRYHPIFGAADIYSVVMTMAFRFEVGGGW